MKPQKKKIVVPQISCVSMLSTTTILSASGESTSPTPQTGFRTQGLQYGGKLIWD